MGKVIVGATMSLDGFMNDRNGDVSRLYPDLESLRGTEMLQEEIQTTGAVVMGRRAYDMAQGDLTDYEYQVPIFVLTHAVPEKGAKGENDKLTLNFVTSGIEKAIEQAKAAAGDKHVTVVGGANTAQQCLRAGLVDEIHIGIVPVFLGEGLRFFEPGANEQMELERYAHLRKYFSFSGNCFKLSPVVGQWMAQLILTGTKPDLQHFTFDRFTQGREIRPRYSSGVLG